MLENELNRTNDKNSELKEMVDKLEKQMKEVEANKQKVRLHS